MFNRESTTVEVKKRQKKNFYGACFFPSDKIGQLCIARPAGILWRVDAITGKVLKKLQFKDHKTGKKLKFGLL